MAYEVTGKLIARFDTVQKSESFKTREFVVEVQEESNSRTFTNYLKFQCVQDRTAILDRFNIGDQLKVQFNIKGSRWERDGRVNYITNLDAWRIELVKMGGSAAPQQYADAPPSDDNSDLPF